MWSERRQSSGDVEFFEGSGAGQKAKIHPDIAKTMISLDRAQVDISYNYAELMNRNTIYGQIFRFVLISWVFIMHHKSYQTCSLLLVYFKQGP